MDEHIRTNKPRQGGGSEPRPATGGAEGGRSGVSGKSPLPGGSSERQQAPESSAQVTRLPSIFRAVRAKCIDCAGGSRKHVRYCPSDGLHSPRCPLWLFRFGLRPETAARRYGADLLDPARMPDASVNLDEMP
jgi:hypothetical protein